MSEDSKSIKNVTVQFINGAETLKFQLDSTEDNMSIARKILDEGITYPNENTFDSEKPLAIGYSKYAIHSVTVM